VSSGKYKSNDKDKNNPTDFAVLTRSLHIRPKHSTEIQKRLLKPIGIELALGPIGWHTFRHTYRSWLDETGAPMKVQQELMRHASIQTTMNVYGQAMPESKRAANGKVVTIVLKPLVKASA
jgi:integrase